MKPLHIVTIIIIIICFPPFILYTTHLFSHYKVSNFFFILNPSKTEKKELEEEGSSQIPHRKGWKLELNLLTATRR